MEGEQRDFSIEGLYLDKKEGLFYETRFFQASSFEEAYNKATEKGLKNLRKIEVQVLPDAFVEFSAYSITEEGERLGTINSEVVRELDEFLPKINFNKE